MDEQDQIRLSVDIYGETYHMKATQDKEQILQVVNMVDKHMRQIGNNMPTLKYKDIAVLAALNIAEEYFKLRTDYNVLLDLIEEDKQ